MTGSDTIDEVARAVELASPREPRRLGEAVAALSAAYNDATKARAPPRGRRARRGLGFLVRARRPQGRGRRFERLLARGWADGLPARPLRRARPRGRAGRRDVGGRPCDSWQGARRDLGRHRPRRARSLALPSLGARRETRPSCPRRALRRGRAEAPRDLPAQDLVIASALVSELDVGCAPDERATRHASLVRGWLERVASGGAVVVVEPALRDRTRHLHRVRDLVLADGETRVVAPCTHDEPCPMLAAEGDWLPRRSRVVDLPRWLVPVASAPPAFVLLEGLHLQLPRLAAPGQTGRARCGRAGGTAPRGLLAPPDQGQARGRLVRTPRDRDRDEGPAHAARVTRLDRDASTAETPPGTPSTAEISCVSRSARGRFPPFAWPATHDGLARARAHRRRLTPRGPPGVRSRHTGKRGLYAIVDTQTLEKRRIDPITFAEALLAAKPAALQLRSKDLPPRDTLALLRALASRARRAGVPLVANGPRRPPPILAGCDNVHVGQLDHADRSRGGRISAPASACGRLDARPRAASTPRLRGAPRVRRLRPRLLDHLRRSTPTLSRSWASRLCSPQRLQRALSRARPRSLSLR